jgi:transmembrane sensor
MSAGPERIDDTLLEQASAWVVRLHGDPQDADLDRFEQWRGQSAGHASAFEHALATWVSVDEHAAADPILAMRRDALARARQVRSRWRPRWLAAAAVAVVVIAPALVWWSMREAPPLEYHTALGEQRVIVLADGSRMSLDALTQVAVRYTDDARNIQLLSGRANFEVAKDVTRPLKVKAGPRTVTAVGTVFTVEREPRTVVVTLLEGVVAVTSRAANAGGAEPRPIELAPLQQLSMSDAGRVELRKVDRDEALAWREGKLVFDDEPLARVIARMNNYGATPLVADGAAAQLRISGVFKAGDTVAFTDALKVYFPLEEIHESGAIHLRLRKLED